MTDPVEPEITPISYFDKSDPRSLINMATKKLKKKLDALPKKYFECTDDELIRWAKPNTVVERLRVAFWNEYGRVQDHGNLQKMDDRRIYGQCCTKHYWYTIVLESKAFLAFIIRPPANYEIRVEEMLNLGLDKLRQVLKLPIKDIKQQPNTKLISEMVKIVVLLDNRHKGGVTQRIEQKNLNLNVTGQAPITRVADIDKEINALEIEIKQLEKAKPSMSEQLGKTAIESDERTIVIPTEAKEVTKA